MAIITAVAEGTRNLPSTVGEDQRRLVSKSDGAPHPFRSSTSLQPTVLSTPARSDLLQVVVGATSGTSTALDMGDIQSFTTRTVTVGRHRSQSLPPPPPDTRPKIRQTTSLPSFLPARTSDPQLFTKNSSAGPPVNAGENSEHATQHSISPIIQLDQVSGFWEKYNKAADFEDREFVKAAGGNLDNLLIFAALFSGVNTAFIVESLKTIQPDQATRTNDLIRSAILTFHNVTTLDEALSDPLFSPSPESVRSTTMFFASLSCSLAAAFGAVLGKQWLNNYEREGGLKPPPGRGRERQKKFDGRAQWHLEGVIETLPTILQISLFLFLAALIDFLWPINRTVGEVVLGFSVALGCFYIIITSIATVYPLSPFQTRLSVTIRSLFTFLRAIPGRLLASVPKIMEALTDLMNHPLEELMETLRLDDLLYVFPDILKPVYLSIILLILWPPCILWRALLFAFEKLAKDTALPDSLSTASIASLILDLRCMIFYAKRVSTPEDLDHLLAGMDTIPTDLQLDPTDSTLTSLSETLIKFVIKPTKLGQSYIHTTPLSPPDFQHLLKPLQLLYSTWGNIEYPLTFEPRAPYFYQYVALIRSRLWDVFALDPKNNRSASLIADVLDATNSFHTTTEPRKDAVAIQTSLVDSIIDASHNSHYIKLLAANLEADENPTLPPGTQINKFVPLVLSALDQDMVDVRRPHSSVWAKVLPEYLGVTALELRFGKYLTSCGESHLHCFELVVRGGPALGGQSDYFENGVTRCLSGVLKLLVQTNDYSTWALTFEEEGLLSFLLRILYPSRGAAPTGLAVLCFVSLWHVRQISDPDEASQASLSHDLVEAVAKNMWAIQTLESVHLGDMDPVGIAKTMEYAVQFFEGASRLGRLTRGMESEVEGFRLDEPSDAYCYRVLEREQLLDLYGRIDRLVFL